MFFSSSHFTKCRLIMTLLSKLSLALTLRSFICKNLSYEKFRSTWLHHCACSWEISFCDELSISTRWTFLNYPLSFLLAHSKIIFIQSQNLQNLLSNPLWKHSFWNANIGWWIIKDILFKSLLKCHDGPRWICCLRCCQSLMSKEDWPCYFSA